MNNYSIREVRNMGKYALENGRLTEAWRRPQDLDGTFDIFLSHSFQDSELILGVRRILERSGKRVYVDWMDDPEMDRTRVSWNTARRLRKRMMQSRSMVYAATKAATTSKWMPWELGYFDGHKGSNSIAVMPLVEYQGEEIGQEYLNLYPVVERPSSQFSSPVIVNRSNLGPRHSSLEDLVAGRGGFGR